MKVAILNSLRERGGAEFVTQKMAQDFKQSGQTVFIIVCGEKTTQDNENEINIYTLKSLFPRLSKYPTIIRLFWQLSNLFNFHKYQQVKNILKAEKPDLVITHNLMGLGYLIPHLIRRLKLDHQHYLHDIQLLHPSGLLFFGQEGKIQTLAAKIYQAITKKLFSKIPQIISPSKWLLDIHQARGFFKTSKTVVKQNFPINKINERPNKTDKQNPDFLYIGQLEAYKGVFLLIKAWTEAGRPGRLFIIGNGSQEAKLKQIAESESQLFIYRYQQEKVDELLTKSDCLIVPSLVYENSPTVIYEAAKANLPIMAANLGGIPELIAQCGGTLFKPNDLQDLANKIKEFS